MTSKSPLGAVLLCACAPLFAFGCDDKAKPLEVSASTAMSTATATDKPVSAEAKTTQTPAPGAATLRRVKTVFVIVFENKAWSEVKGSADAPFLNHELLPKASVAEAYRGALAGNLHPSEPNYIWLEAGSNLQIWNDKNPDANHRATSNHLVTLLDKAGVSWRSYQEDIPGDRCPIEPVLNYAPKHNPMVYFDDVTDGNDPKSRRCIEHVRPLEEVANGTSFASDLAKDTLARYNFVTPNLCNDMHTSCPPLDNTIRQGDEWLAKWMPRIMASGAYKNDGAVFITWDEAEYAASCMTASCPIGALLFSPLAKGEGYSSTVPGDHSSMLRTLEEIFGVKPFLGGAATATDLADLFKP